MYFIDSVCIIGCPSVPLVPGSGEVVEQDHLIRSVITNFFTLYCLFKPYVLLMLSVFL